MNEGKLYVKTDGNLYFLKEDGTEINLSAGATGGGGYWTQSGSSLYPTDITWNVGIGTISPNWRLTVVGGDEPLAVKKGDYYFFVGVNRGGGDYVDIGAYHSTLGWRNLILNRDGGNVGIGTTNPAYKLDVSGTIRAKDVFGAGGKNIIIGDDVFLSDIDTANTLGIYGLQDSTQAHIKLGSNGPVISGKNGKVGIGDSTPDYKLDVEGGDIYASGYVRGGTGLCIGADCRTAWPTGGGGITCADCDPRFVNVTGDTMTGSLTINTSGNDKILLRGTQADPHTIWLGDSKGIRFWDSVNGELMRITNDGKVGIGDPTPNAKLDVSGGDIYVDSGKGLRSETGDLIIDAHSTGRGTVYMYDDVSVSGNLGVGTTPSYKLDVNGNIKWGTKRGILSVDQGASIELGGTGKPYVDFSNDATTDYDMRIQLTGNNELSIKGGVIKTKLPGFTYMGSNAGTINVDGGSRVWLTAFDGLEPNTLHNVICWVNLAGGDTIQYAIIRFCATDYALGRPVAESRIPVDEWVGHWYSVKDTLTFVAGSSGAKVEIEIFNKDPQSQTYDWWCERFMIKTP